MYVTTPLINANAASWQSELADRSPALAPYLAPLLRGESPPWGHTLCEIVQQPETWVATEQALRARTGELQAFLARSGVPVAGAPMAQPTTPYGNGATIILSGSGSSAYAGGLSALGVQRALGATTLSIPDGDLVTHARALLPHGGPLLHVSLARSGNSPESVAACERCRAARPDTTHLIVTCNANGRLAQLWLADPSVTRIVLDPRTNDRSLVMTSSFTNLALATHLVGKLGAPRTAVGPLESSEGTYTETLSQTARDLLLAHADTAASTMGLGPRRAVFLGTGPHLFAAREASLKLTEMTAGKILSFAESFLGLRHGPLSAIDDETLVVAFLSNDPHVRPFERDLLSELAVKRLGKLRIAAGFTATNAVSDDTRPVDYGARPALDEESTALLHVVFGQLLGFFACLALGLAPDAPSPAGVINRVVPPFTIHELAP